MKKRYGIAAALSAALALIMLTSLTAFAGASVSRDEALSTALKNAHLDSSQAKYAECEFEDDENVYEVEFVKAANGAEYGYDIDASTGKILRKSVEYRYKTDSSKDRITEEEAKEVIAKFLGIDYKIVDDGTCVYEYDDGRGTYELGFMYKERAYEFELLAPDGTIMDCEWQTAGY